ncbi:MAG: hypothetical protein K2N60_07815 [Oscillospiraceae bacterium]|nr:hypothetical protein [Oscillospiraceae bacterium]
MKKIFAVSHMCRNGIIGGFIYVTPERLIYQTGKIYIPKALRNIEMPFNDVISAERGKFLFLPTVSFKMKDGGEFKYIIYSVKKFFGTMKELGCDI